MTYPIRIVGFVIDTHNLTMYKADGSTITMPQGDPRIKDLVAALVESKRLCDHKGTGYSHELTEAQMSGRNHYAEVEKKSNGLVRFFKMAKSKLKEIADKFCAPVEPMEVGEKSLTQAQVDGTALSIAEPELPPEEQRPLTSGEAAVAEIMANAVPARTPEFENVVSAETSKATGQDEEVVVAVLADNTVIPSVEKLGDQMAAVTAGLTSVDGMNLFLQRAGSVKRGHSVEDLLTFVQKGELPFADDGSVLVYKRLQSTHEEGVYVDVHSGRVKQSVGSKVFMAESMVDPNRHQDCSNGLHVARRDYLNAFSGDVTVLCKLAPEDVIAVPHSDARKLRAKAYHIIDVLSTDDARRVCNNYPMEDTEKLANAIAGNHVGILQYVEITQAKGGGLRVTKGEGQEIKPLVETRAVTSLDHLPEVSEEAAKVDARALALDVAKDGPKVHAPPAQMNVTSDPLPGTPTPPPLPKAEPVKSKTPAQKLVDAFNEATTPSVKGKAAQDLVDFKKKCKKSWTALGVPAAVWTKAVEIVEGLDVGAKNAVTKADCIPEPAIEAAAKALPKRKPKNDDKSFPVPAVKKAAPKLPPIAAAVLGAAKPSTQKKAAPTPKRKAELQQLAAIQPKAKKMTQQEEMAKLVKLYEANPDKLNARAIYTFKQKSKKSWEVLGVTDVKFQKKITERAKL